MIRFIYTNRVFWFATPHDKCLRKPLFPWNVILTKFYKFTLCSSLLYYSSYYPFRSRNIHSFHGSEEEKINFLKPYTCEKKRKINQETKEMLKNPQIYRVYWWHVVLRFGLEVSQNTNFPRKD